GGCACSAGDVEVHPRRRRDELLEKQPGGQRARAAAGCDVAKVGDVRVESAAIIVGQGHQPHAFTGALRRVLYLLTERIVVCHHRGDLLAQRSRYGALSVARSMIASAPSSSAYDNASARIRRPSASISPRL